MKKAAALILGFATIIILFVGWKFFGPATQFEGKYKYFYVHTETPTKDAVLTDLEKDSIVGSTGSFGWLAARMDYWKQIRPGKYKINSGSSIFSILRILKNGQQSPVNLVITKLRTKEDFAGLAGRKFEPDSTAVLNFLNNSDSLKEYGLDSNTVMTAIFPNTYTYFWNTTPDKIFNKLIAEYNRYWTPEKKQLALAKKLTPQTAYILASIVEEETNKLDEKGTIASVYLNRITQGMRLGADPTVKFALRDFGLKRIYNKHLAVESPYNTYRVTGLPPGPICTPSKATIDAVLNAPATNYLYFVAKSDFSGHHSFAATYPEHLKLARQYQEALNAYMLRKNKTKDSSETQ